MILYAVAAVLLWPHVHHDQPRPDGPASVAAASPLGDPVARLLWLVLWGSLAYFAVQPANRAPNGPHDAVAGLASGEPAWLAGVDRTVASSLAGAGQMFAVVSAVVLAIIALGVFAPPPLARATLILAMLVAAAYWVIGEDLGGIFTGQGTDPNSGPLLILLAVAYWPHTPRPHSHSEETPALANANPGT